jgi:transcriptional regulator with XRE-family HTH domain
MIDKKIAKKNVREPKKEIDPNTLGGRVRWMRKSKGWSQTDLANMCGVTYQNIQNCEMNAIKMPRYIKEIANALDTSIEYLVKGETQPNVVHVPENITLVSADTPIKPDSDADYYVVKVKKNKQLFLPSGAEKVGKVNKVFIGHSN